MAKKQIQCPNCGATLQSTQLLEVECPYCGSKFSNPLNTKNDKASVIKTIIPFKVTEKEVKQAVFQKFISKEDVPQDIFDNLKIISVEQYYLPMYHFSGRFEADWSCTIIYTHTDKQGNTHEELKPANGTASGNFSKLSLAYSGNEIPGRLINYARVLSYTAQLYSKSTKFAPSHLVGKHGTNINVIEPNKNSNACWESKALQDEIDNEAKSAANHQTSGWRTQDYRVSTHWQSDYQDLMLVPVWFGRYTYNDEEYFFAIDGQGGNLDYTYPKDTTNELRGWKIVGRFFLMVGLLLWIAGVTNIHGMKVIIGIIGVGFLTWRFFIEYGKSSDDLSSIKRIGKAKFCGERIPNSSSNYVQYKRNNQVLMWVFILVFGTWCFGTYLMGELENAQIRTQEQQEFDQAQTEIAKVTPDLFFYQSKEQAGHLKQDVRKELNELGFIKEENEAGEYGDKYTLYSNQLPLVNVFLNFSIGQLYSNSSDEIKGIKITIVDDRFSSDFIERFKSQLTEKGYEIKSYPTSNNYPSRPHEAYMLIGKEAFIEKENIFGFDKHYATYNAIVIRSNEIECYAKDEFQEDMKTGYEMILTDSVTNDDVGLMDTIETADE